jgi:hypothetical protein
MIVLSALERRHGIRMPSHFHVTTHCDGRRQYCLGLDLSPSGALVRRSSFAPAPLVQRLEIELGGRLVLGAARTVWSRGELQALRFVGMADVDRLEIAEHLDRLVRLMRGYRFAS